MVKKHAKLGVLAVTFVGLAFLLSSATTDTRPGPGSFQPRRPRRTQPATQAIQPTQYVGSVPDHIRPQAHQPQRRRSIVHHYPYPYPGATTPMRPPAFATRAASAGTPSTIRPATASRLREIPCAVAQFGVGGYPSQADQRAAQQVGISRYNSIQRHIDNYAMPRYGYGFGMGGFGGFW